LNHVPYLDNHYTHQKVTDSKCESLRSKALNHKTSDSDLDYEYFDNVLFLAVSFFETSFQLSKFTPFQQICNKLQLHNQPNCLTSSTHSKQYRLGHLVQYNNVKRLTTLPGDTSTPPPEANFSIKYQSIPNIENGRKNLVISPRLKSSTHKKQHQRWAHTRSRPNSTIHQKRNRQ
jgi:hypothetical protein